MTKSETWEDAQAFQAAVAEERAQALTRRRIACVLARALVGVSAAFVFVMLVVTLLGERGSPLFLVLLIVAEVQLLRLGHALSDDLKWPKPRNLPPPFTPEWLAAVQERQIRNRGQ